MADVARLVGVSAMTVSRALRREGAVSDRTRARILEVVDEIGYVPDQAAGALSSGRSGLVVAVMPSFSLPMYSQMAKGLSETLADAGLQLFFDASDYSADREEQIVEAALRRRPEALILAGLGHTQKAARLAAGAGIPVVEFLDGSTPPIGHLVEIDPVALGRATVDYLARKDRKRIAVAISRSGDPRGEARFAGLVAAARARDLPEPIALKVGEPSRVMEQGAAAASLIVSQKAPVDALVTMTDGAAIGAITTLREAGLRTPDDVAVFGFGDCDVARHMTPPLTSVGFNAVAAGVEIGKILLSALDAERLGTPRSFYRLTIDFHIVERASA